MLRRFAQVLVFALFAVACTSESATAPEADRLAVSPQLGSNAGNPVVHRASVGGADVCSGESEKPGCDANFSLVANEFADGSVKGQWQDTYVGGIAVHVTVDCLYVSGNEAWVSGPITGGVFAGFPVIARVVDNGTSANDAADQISYMHLDTYGGCTAAPTLALYDMNEGQVKVW